MAVITIGPGATDRAGVMGFGGYTDIDFNSPADGSGTITALDVFFASGAVTGLKVGTFYRHATSNTYFGCRDSAVIAPPAVESKQTITADSGGTPLAIKVNMGDFLGATATVGFWERDTTGYSGVYYYAGDACNSGDVVSYTWLSGDAFSIFGSGATPAAAGGAWTQFAKAPGIAFDVVKTTPGINKDDTSKVIGIAV